MTHRGWVRWAHKMITSQAPWSRAIKSVSPPPPKCNKKAHFSPLNLTQRIMDMSYLSFLPYFLSCLSSLWAWLNHARSGIFFQKLNIFFSQFQFQFFNVTLKSLIFWYYSFVCCNCSSWLCIIWALSVCCKSQFFCWIIRCLACDRSCHGRRTRWGGPPLSPLCCSALYISLPY